MMPTRLSSTCGTSFCEVAAPDLLSVPEFVVVKSAVYATFKLEELKVAFDLTMSVTADIKIKLILIFCILF